MKKDEVLLLLEEGVSIEEVPTLINLDELEELIDWLQFDPSFKKELMKGIRHLKKETIQHSRFFNELAKYVLKSDKNGY